MCMCGPTLAVGIDFSSALWRVLAVRWSWYTIVCVCVYGGCGGGGLSLLLSSFETTDATPTPATALSGALYMCAV